jgi:iron complex outermembrane receptor protein
MINFEPLIIGTYRRLSPFLLALSGFGVLNAQEINSASPTNQPERLPSVIVFAEKQPADVQTLPVSVMAVTAETIRHDDIRFVKDAEGYAPNVFVNEFSARKLSNPYFRGIGSSPNNPGVTTYIDGVPQLNANSSSIELLDVEQIEFVRGAQGTLFGRDTVGGVINISSRRPSVTDYRADGQAEYGNYDFRDVRFSLSGPIMTDVVGLSLAAGYSARDGYTKNDVTGHDLDSRDAYFGKAQFLWLPGNLWEVRLIVTGERARDGDYALGDLGFIRAHPHHVARDFEGYTHRDVLAPTLIATHDGPAVDFSMAAGLVWWQTHDLTDLDYTPIPAVTRNNFEKEVQFTDELRFASAKDAPLHLADNFDLKWQAGALFFAQDYHEDAANNYSPGILYQPNQFGKGFPPFASPANTQHSPRAELRDIGVGPYAQLTLVSWDKLDLTAGVRGDYEAKDANLRTYFATPDPFLGPGKTNKLQRDFTEVSPSFSAAWHVDKQTMVYASARRGYKAGGFNPESPSGKESYGEEHSWNYEIGAKTSWFDDRLSLNVAAFYIDRDNLQLNLPTGIPAQFFTANSGKADSKGVEAELHARPLPGWDIFAGIGYTDARFRSGATAGHIDALGASSTENVAGNHLSFAPEFTGNAGTEYTFPICSHASLFARAEVFVFGRYYYNAANTASQGSYYLANFRAGVRGSHWFAEAWIRNAFDAHYVPIAFEFPNGAFGGSGFVGESGAPVTFGGRIGVTF